MYKTFLIKQIYKKTWQVIEHTLNDKKNPCPYPAALPLPHRLPAWQGRGLRMTF